MKYMSKEHLEAIKEKANADATYLKKTKGLSFKFQNLVTDCPGGVDKVVTWELERGKILSVNLEEKPAPSDWRKMPFDGTKYFMRTVGDWPTYVKLNKKEITPIQGMTSGGFRLDGDLMKVMAKLAEFTILLDLESTIPCEY